MAAKASAWHARGSALRKPRWRSVSSFQPARHNNAVKTLRTPLSPRMMELGALPFPSSNRFLRHRGLTADAPFTGFELLFLGTNAGAPSMNRNPTALCLQMEGQNWMIDCAEGSLRQLMRSSIRVPATSKFFITHLHGDHVFGLPGMLCTLDSFNAAYTDPKTKEPCPRPIELYGPLGLFSYLNTTLSLSGARLPNLHITIHEFVSDEIHENTSKLEKLSRQTPHHPSLDKKWIHPRSDGNGQYWKVVDNGQVVVKAAALQHTVPTFGYVFEEHKTRGKLDAAKLRATGLRPGPKYQQIKRGKDVEMDDGTVLRSQDYVAPDIPGRKIVILGDNCDASRMYDLGYDCDILVHEATLGHDMVRKAVARGHSTGSMAGYAARRMNAKLLALTHFSHRFMTWSKASNLHTTQHLALEASLSSKRRAVVPAYDLMRIPVRKKTS